MFILHGVNEIAVCEDLGSEMSGAMARHVNAEIGSYRDPGSSGRVPTEGDGPGAGELEVAQVVQLAGKNLGKGRSADVAATNKQDAHGMSLGGPAIGRHPGPGFLRLVDTAVWDHRPSLKLFWLKLKAILETPLLPGSTYTSGRSPTSHPPRSSATSLRPWPTRRSRGPSLSFTLIVIRCLPMRLVCG